MHIVADRVFPDEPCYSLFERAKLMPQPDGSIQRRWLQTVFVVRGDALAKYETDFGPAENYAEVPPLMIPSLGDDTVAQLQEMAERHRHDDKWIKYRKERQAESTLIQDVLRQMEEDREWIANRSVFGPKHTVQRNVYDSSVARRKIRDRYKEYTGIVPQGGK